MTTREQIGYYNERWSEVEFANNWEMARCAFFLLSLHRLQAIQPSILDLGSGTGWLSNVLSVFGRVHAIELSPEAVRRATMRFPLVTFECADVFAWKVPESQFDVVVSQEVIEHVDQQLQYLDVVRRALKARGHLILTTPNALAFDSLSAERLLSGWPPQPIENRLTSRALKQLVWKAGFEIIDLTSLLPINCDKGVYRWVNSSKVSSAFQAMGCGGLWDVIRNRAGFGLHLGVVARKRS